MTSFFAAWRAGIARVWRAPAVLAGVWALTVFASVPLAAAMRDAIRTHLGDSLAADTAAAGVNHDWMQEFGAQATGMATTFKPEVIGFAAVVDNLSAFLDTDSRPLVIIAAVAVYLALWIFLAGGIIDRLARNRVTGAHGFFAGCGVFFFRFLRLGLLMGAAYGLIFGYLHPWLFDTWYPRITHDIAVERTAFLIRIALYAVFGLVLGACNLVFDYAKVRAVVEDRRSMIGATLAALRFIRQHPATIALYAADFALFLIVVALYALVAPGAGGAGWSMWIAFAIGQAYVIARLWVKLVFWAGEAALFQGRLAHAGYVAAPKPVWPDSPMVEAIGN